MGWSQLTAINTAKALTIVLLLVLAAVIGVQDMRQVLYLSLHISYCLWGLLEQWLFPERARQLFNERVGGGELWLRPAFHRRALQPAGAAGLSQSRAHIPGRRGPGTGAI